MQPIRRHIALLLLIVYLPACSSYQMSGLAPTEAVAGRDEVEVQVGEGSSAESARLRHPWVRNDSIGGEHRVCEPRRNRSLPWQCEYAPWAMPLAEISGIKTRQFDGGEVAALVAGIAIVVGGVALVGASQPMFEVRQ